MLIINASVNLRATSWSAPEVRIVIQEETRQSLAGNFNPLWNVLRLYLKFL
jgi:hypothetical protein